MGDFPDANVYREMLKSHKLDKFEKVGSRITDGLETVLQLDLPQLLEAFPAVDGLDPTLLPSQNTQRIEIPPTNQGNVQQPAQQMMPFGQYNPATQQQMHMVQVASNSQMQQPMVSPMQMQQSQSFNMPYNYPAQQQYDQGNMSLQPASPTVSIPYS